MLFSLFVDNRTLLSLFSELSLGQRRMITLRKVQVSKFCMVPHSRLWWSCSLSKRVHCPTNIVWEWQVRNWNQDAEIPDCFFVFTVCQLPCWWEVLQDGCKVDRRLNKKTRLVADWLLQHHCQCFFYQRKEMNPQRKNAACTMIRNSQNEGMELVCLADNREMNCSYILLIYQNSFY